MKPKSKAAIRDIINAFNRFSLPSIWGTGKKAAADGSKFEIYENYFSHLRACLQIK